MTHKAGGAKGGGAAAHHSARVRRVQIESNFLQSPLQALVPESCVEQVCGAGWIIRGDERIDLQTIGRRLQETSPAPKMPWLCLQADIPIMHWWPWC